VAALTGEKVHNSAGKLEKMPDCGSDILGLLTVFIMMLISCILGLSKVSPVTRSVKWLRI